jgi:RNA polymerase sigma factor (sigma-70 family)
MTDDVALLRQHAGGASPAAFDELVRRHIDFVYAAALRQVHGDTAMAQDVTQQVFLDLARKAAAVARHPVLAGWLFTSTRFAAQNAMRRERRRRAREQAAQFMHEMSESSGADDWRHLGPLIDDAMAGLEPRDRDAVLLRYFENRQFPEIGARMSLSADAARLRVERAMEKIRVALGRRGVKSTATALAMALANQPAIAAPAGLATAIAGASLLAPAGVAFTFMSTTKALVALSVVAVIGTGGVWWGLHRRAEQREEQAMRLAVERRVAEIAPRPVASPTALSAREPVARTVGVSVAGPSVAAAVEPTSKTGRVATVEPAAVVSDAALRRAAQSRRLTLRRYGSFLDQLTLSEAQRERLIQLLIDVREASPDLAAAEAAGGVDASDDSETFQVSAHSLRQGLNERIKTLLGEEGYERFLAADVAVRQAAVVERMQKNLKPQAAPLTPAQSEQLLEVMRDLQVNHVTAEVVAGAGAFLSPPQLAALQALQQRREQGVLKDNLQKTIHDNLPPGK